MGTGLGGGLALLPLTVPSGRVGHNSLLENVTATLPTSPTTFLTWAEILFLLALHLEKWIRSMIPTNHLPASTLVSCSFVAPSSCGCGLGHATDFDGWDISQLGTSSSWKKCSLGPLPIPGEQSRARLLGDEKPCGAELGYLRQSLPPPPVSNGSKICEPRGISQAQIHKK